MLTSLLLPFLKLLALLFFFTTTLPSQSCPIERDGPSGTGLKCSIVPGTTTPDGGGLEPATTGGDRKKKKGPTTGGPGGPTTTKPGGPMGGAARTGVLSPFNSLLDSMVGTIEDGGVGLPKVLDGNQGTFHMASGEFRFRLPFGHIGGIAYGSDLPLFATYRSYFASAGSVDVDPTGHLPFGPGWLPSYADALLKPAGIWVPGDDMTRVGPLGAKWVQTGAVQVVDPNQPSSVRYVYSPDHGSRLVYDNGVFYREYPSRIRIEYEKWSDYATLPAGAPGYHIKRIYKGKDSTNPDWQILYEYEDVDPDPNAARYRLVRIKGVRGFTFAFGWSLQGQGANAAYRLTSLSLGNSNIPSSSLPTGWDWNAFTTQFLYDSQARLYEIRFPDKTFKYDPSGSFTMASYTGFGYRFTYHATSGLLEKTYRVLKTSTGGWTNPVVETYLQNTYGDPNKPWFVTQQIEGVSSSNPGTYTYSNPGGGQTISWTDPEGIQHETSYVAIGGSSSPVKWHVSSYTRKPRPNKDPSGLGNQTWQFEWAGCGCGWLSAIQLPTGRRMEWTYDGEGRGLVTEVRIKDSPTDGNPRKWNLVWEPWGDAFDTGSQWEKSSRPKSLTYFDLSNNPVVWTLTYAASAQGGGRTTLVIPNPAGGSFDLKVDEDALGRITHSEGPLFQVDRSATTARVIYDFQYQDNIALPGYGLLSRATTQRPDENGNMVSVFSDSSYDPLGREIQEVDEQGRSTFYEYDLWGDLTKVTLPPFTSEKSGQAITTILTMEYGFFGNIVKATRTANDADNQPYGRSSIYAESSVDFFGNVIRSRKDKAKLSDPAPSWLESVFSYDKLSRLVQEEGSHGQLTKYELDDFDMISEVKARPKVGTPEAQWPTRFFHYNAEGKKVWAQDATGFVEEYEYGASGRLSKFKRSAIGKEVRLDYYAQGSFRPPWKTSYWVLLNGSYSKRTESVASYDAMLRITSKTFQDVPSSAQRSLSYFWNGPAFIDRLLDGNGREAYFGFDAAGRLHFTEDNLSSGNKNRLTVKRSEFSEVVEVESLLQKELAAGGYTSVTRKNRFSYDEWGRVKRVDRYGTAGSSQARIRKAWDSLGNLVWSEVEEASNDYLVTEWEYDALGRVHKTIRHPRSAIGGNDIVTTTDFDDSPGLYGNDGFGTTLDSNLLSLVITRTDARGLNTKFLYDKLGRLLEKRLPGYAGAGLGYHWSYQYDDEGRLDRWKDGNGHVIDLVRDSQKRVIRRYVSSFGGGSTLSLMATYEEWAYDEANWKVTNTTYRGDWFGGTAVEKLDEITETYDGLGRIFSEAFGFSDNGSGAPQWTKTLTHGYSYGSGQDDTGFRRSLQFATGFQMGFTPDATGKTKGIQLTNPGSSQAFSLADYFWEGGRVHQRDQKVSAGMTAISTSFEVDVLGYSKKLTATQGQTTLFQEERLNDLAGNVLWKKYTKVSGKQGDRYNLDGFNRLVGAKLGVNDFSSSYGAVTVFDKKLTLALDAAQNWQSKTEETSSGTTTTNYVLDPSSNRYQDAGTGFLTYDLNGNLVFDGFRMYVYDYLDRLSEVYEYYPDTQNSTNNKNSTQRTQRKPFKLTWSQVKVLLESTHQKVSINVAKEKGLSAYNKLLKTSRQKSNTSNSSGGTWVLIAVYGYDTNSRRLYRSTLTGEGVRWQTYDGWQVADEFEEVPGTGGNQLEARKAYFDGLGIDEHLGFARSLDGTNWTHYNLIQDLQGNVMSVVDTSGAVLERYEYDPYGKRRIFTPNGTGGWNEVYASTVENHYGYTGRRHDPETGFLYYRYRYYLPSIGRFLTHDPIGNWGDPGNFGNGYASVANAGHQGRDPFGLLSLVSTGIKAPNLGSGGLEGGGGYRTKCEKFLIKKGGKKIGKIEKKNGGWPKLPSREDVLKGLGLPTKRSGESDGGFFDEISHMAPVKTGSKGGYPREVSGVILYNPENGDLLSIGISGGYTKGKSSVHSNGSKGLGYLAYLFDQFISLTNGRGQNGLCTIVMKWHTHPGRNGKGGIFGFSSNDQKVARSVNAYPLLIVCKKRGFRYLCPKKKPKRYGTGFYTLGIRERLLDFYKKWLKKKGK